MTEDMSELRDRIAIAAFTAMLTRFHTNKKIVAKDAYEYATEMMHERRRSMPK